MGDAMRPFSVSTHPDIAALVTPLYASVKEGAEKEKNLIFLNPLCGKGEERVVQRSVDRVS
ncbi:hypothetical protein DIU36_26680 [Mucilaginibacter rubeus]|nr:hypothetical protein DIU36_26680 [Mucilaginibacter rubeus]